MCITANRFPEVRATVCYNEYEAQMARKHLNSNILVLGARVTEDMGLVGKIIDTWLETRRSPEEKYTGRIKKIESSTQERW